MKVSLDKKNLLTCQAARTKIIKLKQLEMELNKNFEFAMQAHTHPQEMQATLGRSQKLNVELHKSIYELRREMLLHSMERARETIGKKNFIGPEEINEYIKINFDEVPQIPYSDAELKDAKLEGMMLVLRMSKDRDGNDLTVQKLNEILQPRMKKGTKLLNGSIESTSPHCLTTETCTMQWKLVTNEHLQNSTGKDYLQQTQLIRDWAKLNDELTPEEEQECSDAVLKELSMLSSWSSNWREAARRLSELKVNKNHRTTMVESFWDIALTFLVHQRNRVERDMIWTTSIGANGSLFVLGNFTDDGMTFAGTPPMSTSGTLGVTYTR